MTRSAMPMPKAVAGFLAFSHGWTWLFWLAVIVRGVDVWSAPLSVALLLLGGLGVPLGGVVMTWRTDGGAGVRSLGRRLIRPGRIPDRWWVVVLLLLPALKLAAAGLAVLLGGVEEALRLDDAARLLARPADLLAYLGFVLILGPLPEEIGWRGYLLDRLQQEMSALGASLAVGVAWLTWHLPLFFMAGYYARAGGPPHPLQFGVAIILASVLYTWIFNNTGRSVLAVVLFHWVGNVAGELLDATPTVYVYETGLTAVVVLLVLWSRGGDTLEGRS